MNLDKGDLNRIIKKTAPKRTYTLRGCPINAALPERRKGEPAITEQILKIQGAEGRARNGAWNAYT